MTMEDDSLEELRLRASSLASAAESLASLLDEEAVRLKRHDQVDRLHKLRSAITRDMEEARDVEDRARSGEVQLSAFDSGTALATGVIAELFKSKGFEVVSDHLLAAPANRKATFGTVLVAIGPEGLPDDVRVAPVSRLARESKRDESQVIDSLRKQGNLLLAEKAFSGLIDTVASEILKGTWDLPISAPRLTTHSPIVVMVTRVTLLKEG